MANELAKAETALVNGDLSKLSPDERTAYYLRVCESIGINPLTKPFEYITLNGKLTLYARKDCTDQLRKVHGVSINEPTIKFEDDWIVVAVTAKLPDGRADSDIGVVNRKDMRGDFGNALMKAVTKAKRRVTLSICGLGMLDETEVETIPGAVVKPVELPKQLPEKQPEPPKPDAQINVWIDEARSKIQNAKSVDELAAVWSGLTPEIQSHVLSVKNRRKEELRAQAAA